jgi:hypothetical protein
MFSSIAAQFVLQRRLARNKQLALQLHHFLDARVGLVGLELGRELDGAFSSAVNQRLRGAAIRYCASVVCMAELACTSFMRTSTCRP